MELQFTYPALQLRQFLSSLNVNLSKRKEKLSFIHLPLYCQLEGSHYA
jgi:hypothetical protein